MYYVLYVLNILIFYVQKSKTIKMYLIFSIFMLGKVLA